MRHAGCRETCSLDTACWKSTAFATAGEDTWEATSLTGMTTIARVKIHSCVSAQINHCRSSAQLLAPHTHNTQTPCWSWKKKAAPHWGSQQLAARRPARPPGPGRRPCCPARCGSSPPHRSPAAPPTPAAALQPLRAPRQTLHLRWSSGLTHRCARHSRGREAGP